MQLAVSEIVSDSGNNDGNTGIVYQGMLSSDDRCDLNCVVSTGEDNQSSNTDIQRRSNYGFTTCFHYRQASSSVSKSG